MLRMSSHLIFPPSVAIHLLHHHPPTGALLRHLRKPAYVRQYEAVSHPFLRHSILSRDLCHLQYSSSTEPFRSPSVQPSIVVSISALPSVQNKFAFSSVRRSPFHNILETTLPYPTLPYPIPWLLIRYLVPARCQQQSTTPSVCAFSPTNVDSTLDLTLHSSSLSVHSIQVITLHFSILRLSSHRIFPPYCSEKCETDRIHHRSLSPFHSICPPTFPPFSNQFLPFHPSVQTLFACLAPSTSLSFYLHPSDNTNHTLPYPTLP